MNAGSSSLIDVGLAISVGIPALIAVAGWFLVHWLNARREVYNKRREIRLRGLESAFMKLAMIAQRDWTEERKQQFESFVAEIQLYGTPRQIELTIEVVKAFIEHRPEISFDALLEELRDSLRKELRMEPVKAHVWWYRFTLPEWSRSAQRAPKEPPTPPASDRASS